MVLFPQEDTGAATGCLFGSRLRNDPPSPQAAACTQGADGTLAGHCSVGLRFRTNSRGRNDPHSPQAAACTPGADETMGGTTSLQGWGACPLPLNNARIQAGDRRTPSLRGSEKAMCGDGLCTRPAWFAHRGRALRSRWRLCHRIRRRPDRPIH